jgi:excisionase family DNA binding protein
MSDLLTAKQVQDLLLVDRTTVYRMLKDGRLRGTKIGQQWRFRREDVQALLSPGVATARSDVSGAAHAGGETATTLADLNVEALPLQCVQAVQDVFAEIAQVGSVTTDAEGQPLTDISNACRFCRLILASPSGRKACIASWRQLAQESEGRPRFVHCHAGLQYARAAIQIDGEGSQLNAMLIAGQFYSETPDAAEESLRVEALAEAHGLDRRALAAAASELPVLDLRMQSQIGRWLEKVADMFEEIGRERAEFVSRLRTIAELSSI